MSSLYAPTRDGSIKNELKNTKKVNKRNIAPKKYIGKVMASRMEPKYGIRPISAKKKPMRNNDKIINRKVIGENKIVFHFLKASSIALFIELV